MFDSFLQISEKEKKQNGPCQAKLVLIAYASSEGIRTVSPEPPLLAHTSSESRGTFRQKARFLNGLACAIKICHDRMLEDTNSLDAPQIQESHQFPLIKLHQKMNKNVWKQSLKRCWEDRQVSMENCKKSQNFEIEVVATLL